MSQICKDCQGRKSEQNASSCELNLRNYTDVTLVYSDDKVFNAHISGKSLQQMQES